MPRSGLRALLVASAAVGLMVADLAGAEPAAKDGTLRIVVVGAHCDDPESGCGGLIARLAGQGHDVIVAYATCFRGDRTIGNEPEAVVRRREAVAACRVLGATPHFFPYAHEKLAADEPTVAAVGAWLDDVRPDIVVTHWPLDCHPNHHVTNSLVWQSYLRARKERKWHLYFYECLTGVQTLGFRPDLYLDIGDVRDRKRDACFCHLSQKPDEFWAAHEEMHRRRGAECGVRFAEAFVLVEPLPGRPLLPVSFVPKKTEE